MKRNWGLVSIFPRPLARVHSTLRQRLHPSQWWVFLPRELVTAFRTLATESTRPRSLREGAGGSGGALLWDLLSALGNPLPGWWCQTPRLSLLLYCHPPHREGSLWGLLAVWSVSANEHSAVPGTCTGGDSCLSPMSRPTHAGRCLGFASIFIMGVVSMFSKPNEL